ncbi:hypothetical protein [Shewanella canadensis]|uniref:hypothetical protein n=1 Tax=Shewanella canadensis TaxID=271096 RepID=UPI00163A3CB4|nr:hypothetical protein [Shewanella canadensis]
MEVTQLISAISTILKTLKASDYAGFLYSLHSPIVAAMHTFLQSKIFTNRVKSRKLQI